MTAAAVARAYRALEVFVNMSHLTVSEMDLTSTAESVQQRQHWLVEQVLDWSGLPVVQVRPTVFMENPLFRTGFSSIAKDGTIRLPFGRAKTSPVAAGDVAAVVEEILADPAPHIGRTYELTGPRSQDIAAMASEVSATLGRPVCYTDVPLQEWPGQGDPLPRRGRTSRRGRGSQSNSVVDSAFRSHCLITTTHRPSRHRGRDHRPSQTCQRGIRWSTRLAADRACGLGHPRTLTVRSATWFPEDEGRAGRRPPAAHRWWHPPRRGGAPRTARGAPERWGRPRSVQGPYREEMAILQASSAPSPTSVRGP